MEPLYRQSYRILDSDVDCFGRLSPARILFFAQDSAGQHCQRLSLNYDVLAKKHLFWAVLRHRVQVIRYPMVGETITVETWPMPTTRSAYPRSTVAYDSQGREVFRAISLWALMHMDNRTLVLPDKSGIEVAGLLRGSELAAPGSMALIQAGNRQHRQVCFTDLDRNGHMNNCRYLAWISDLLPSAFHQKNAPKEFTVCYFSEAREGQNLLLQWSLSDGPALAVDGLRADGEHSRVFSVRMQF